MSSRPQLVINYIPGCFSPSYQNKIFTCVCFHSGSAHYLIDGIRGVTPYLIDGIGDIIPTGEGLVASDCAILSETSLLLELQGYPA